MQFRYKHDGGGRHRHTWWIPHRIRGSQYPLGPEEFEFLSSRGAPIYPSSFIFIFLFLSRLASPHLLSSFLFPLSREILFSSPLVSYTWREPRTSIARYDPKQEKSSPMYTTQTFLSNPIKPRGFEYENKIDAIVSWLGIKLSRFLPSSPWKLYFKSIRMVPIL